MDYDLVITQPYNACIFCSGKILHIDFGDCFEASMNREKFPEKVSHFLPNSSDSSLVLISIFFLYALMGLFHTSYESYVAFSFPGAIQAYSHACESYGG